jgi:putative DNA primase/helicase
MERNIGDEGIYLRLQQLQKGLLQFTDTTNAYRLLTEHGKDIRYNVLWKKWLVWNGSHWSLDDGYLIHRQGFEDGQGDLRGTPENSRLSGQA